jgi:copper chaperone NosL
MNAIRNFIGPRAPANITSDEKALFRLPTRLLWLAAILLLVSVFLPYWEMDLNAPQYPGGLHLTAYANRLTGDVSEIDGLNHYIGMRPLGEAAQFEKSVSILGIVTLALLITAATFIHTKWVTLFALPAVFMPAIFLADLAWWMREFGLNLDPKAPLSAAIEPFVPNVLGKGVIAQFETVAWPGTGLYLAILASILIIVGLYYHRKAYKPLVDNER